MAKNVTLSHTFGGLSGTIPLSYLDDDYTNFKDAFASFNSFSNYLVDTGAVNAYAASLGAGLTGTIAAGLMVQLKIANTNTTTSTFAFNGGTAKNILNPDGTALTAGALLSGGIYILLYDGTQYILIGGGITYSTSTFTATLTGCSTTPTYSVKYTTIGNLVTLMLPALFSGLTSNATSKTLTGAPVAVRPSATVNFFGVGVAIDNGGSSALGAASIASSGVISLFSGFTGGSWTASGAASFCPNGTLQLTYTTA